MVESGQVHQQHDAAELQRIEAAQTAGNVDLSVPDDDARSTAEVLQQSVGAPPGPQRDGEIVDAGVDHMDIIVHSLPELAPNRERFDCTVHFQPHGRTIRAPRYRVTYQEQQIMAIKVRELVEKGYWVPGATPDTATVMVVKRPGKV